MREEKSVPRKRWTNDLDLRESVRCLTAAFGLRPSVNIRELIGKYYYPATVRGYEVIQFNLMNPNLTNTFNPLINALQKFRRNDDVKGQALIDGIVDTLWPDNGEIWNPAAGNMFRRAVYMLFSVYIDQERYIRYLGYKNNVAPELIEQSVNENYSKITLFNV